MALPQNKNIRRITVNNTRYYWNIKYNEDYGLICCHIGLVDEPNFRFSFYRGASKSHVRYIQNGIEEKDQIEAITPSLVAEAIVFANENLEWKNSEPTIIISDSKGFRIE